MGRGSCVLNFSHLSSIFITLALPIYYHPITICLTIYIIHHSWKSFLRVFLFILMESLCHSKTMKKNPTIKKAYRYGSKCHLNHPEFKSMIRGHICISTYTLRNTATTVAIPCFKCFLLDQASTLHTLRAESV